MPEERKSLYKESYDQLAQMEEQRRPKDSLSAEIQRLMRPELPPWGDVDNTKAGQKGNIEVYSSAPQNGVEIMADGLQGHLASKAMTWFNYEMADEELNEIPLIRDWLQHRAKVTYRLFADSNYYSSLNPCLMNGITFGDAPSWMEKNREENGISTRNFYPRNIWISRDATGAVIRFVYGNYEMTVLEAVGQLGKENLSQALNDDFKNGNLLTKYKFSHFTLSKDDPILKDRKDIPDRPWVSYYCQNDVPDNEQKIIIPPDTGGGYWTQPFSHWRQREIIGMPYGWGQGCSAIISIYGVNEAAKQLLTAGNLAIDPAMFVPSKMKGRVDIQPRGRTYGDPAAKPEILYDGGKYAFGADMHDRLREEVYNWFETPFFTQLRNATWTMTAFEISKRIEETGILLEPKIGRFETDKLDQDHNRVFDLADQMELADPPPPILFQKLEELSRRFPGRKDLGRINVVYNGRLVQAMRMARLNLQADTLINVVGALASQQQQLGAIHTVWDRYDIDQLGLEIGRGVDLPEKVINSDDEVARIRTDRERAIAKQNQIDMAERAAAQVPNLQKKTEEGSPLEAMAGAET